MSLLNRPLLGIVAFFGISSIIGSGFCLWTFAGEGSELNSNVDAKIEISTLADVGRVRFVGNLEAQAEIRKDNANNGSVSFPVDNQSNWKNLKTIDSIDLPTLNKLYTTRKIVFGEGNDDPLNLKDGLTFYRFKMDETLKVRTFIRENEVRGGYVFVPYDEYNAIIKSGSTFKIGLKISLSTGANSISEYLDIDEAYDTNNESAPTFSINRNGVIEKYLDLRNEVFSPNTFTTLTDTSELSDEEKELNKSEFSNKYVEDFSNCYVFSFEINLQDMFSYLPGKKPNDSSKLMDLKNSISNFNDLWVINFDIVTTYL